MAQELNDQDIFNEAVSDKPAPQIAEKQPEQPATETTEDTASEEKTTRQRDDKGRFVSAATDDPSQEDEAKAEPTEVEDQSEPEPEKEPRHVPLNVLLDERDKRQAEQRQREALQQQLWQVQQELQKLKAPKQEPIDMFAEPEKFQGSIMDQIAQMRKEMAGEFSLRLAANKHGETFQQAWNAMLGRTQMGDDSIRQQVIASPDPGEALVNWYQREQTMELVGTGGIEAFTERLLEEALNNPEYLARAVEKAKGEAATRPTQVKLPPSVNKASGASSGNPDANFDLNDANIFRYAMQR